jgi:hypothetical protein
MHLLARQFTYDENDRSSLHLKNMGFRQVELEPPIPDSGRKADIKICDDGTEIFIEVSTKEGPEINYIYDFGPGIKGGPFEFQSPKTYKDKIERKSNRQLSNFHPGIIVLYLDPSCIPERRNIRKALYDGIAWRTNGEVVCLEKGESACNGQYNHFCNFVVFPLL